MWLEYKIQNCSTCYNEKDAIAKSVIAVVALIVVLVYILNCAFKNLFQKNIFLTLKIECIF